MFFWGGIGVLWERKDLEYGNDPSLFVLDHLAREELYGL